MAIALWSALFDDVLPSVPGVPQVYATACIQDAAIEFFERAKCWTEESDAINAVANTKEYAFVKSSLSTGASPQVVEFRQVFWNGMELDFVSQLDAERGHQNWMTLSGSQPKEYLSIKPNYVRLIPYPTASVTGAIKMNCTLRPTKSSTGIEDYLLEEFRDAIACGAKAKILATPGKPYASLQDAAIEKDAFETAIATHQNRAQKGRTRARRAVTTRFM